MALRTRSLFGCRPWKLHSKFSKAFALPMGSLGLAWAVSSVWTVTQQVVAQCSPCKTCSHPPFDRSCYVQPRATWRGEKLPGRCLNVLNAEPCFFSRGSVPGPKGQRGRRGAVEQWSSGAVQWWSGGGVGVGWGELGWIGGWVGVARASLDEGRGLRAQVFVKGSLRWRRGVGPRGRAMLRWMRS